MQVWPLEAGLPRSLIWYRPRATANDDSPPDTFQCILRIGRTVAQNGEGSCGLTKVKLKKITQENQVTSCLKENKRARVPRALP